MHFCIILHCLGLTKYIAPEEGHAGYQLVLLLLLVTILHCPLARHHFFELILHLVIIVPLLL